MRKDLFGAKHGIILLGFVHMLYILKNFLHVSVCWNMTFRKIPRYVISTSTQFCNLYHFISWILIKLLTSYISSNFLIENKGAWDPRLTWAVTYHATTSFSPSCLQSMQICTIATSFYFICTLDSVHFTYFCSQKEWLCITT